ncbi:MAG: DUF3108 domain-containing protein [Bacteroidota bacterium]|jgi:hypothetical protein
MIPVLLLHLLWMFSETGKMPCRQNQIAFSTKEDLHYHIYYNLGPIWVNAGEVHFTSSSINYHSLRCYRFRGVGRTYSGYDWIFKVRDKFESIVDSGSFRPLKYLRDTHEGANSTYNDNYFNNLKNIAYTFLKRKDGIMHRDTVPITPCTYDVLTMIYYARNIDYSSLKPGTDIPVSIFLDAKSYDKQSIRYLGKENLKTEFGTFRCIKFQPKLIAGTIFKEGDSMIVWVTDDKNKIPLLVETPILVGSIKARIKSIENPLYPLKPLPQ